MFSVFFIPVVLVCSVCPLFQWCWYFWCVLYPSGVSMFSVFFILMVLVRSMSSLFQWCWYCILYCSLPPRYPPPPPPPSLRGKPFPRTIWKLTFPEESQRRQGCAVEPTVINFNVALVFLVVSVTVCCGKAQAKAWCGSFTDWCSFSRFAAESWNSLFSIKHAKTIEPFQIRTYVLPFRRPLNGWLTI